MHVFSVTGEAEFNPKKHVEKILGTIADGDVTVACWEPGQISPNHCHPHATEIYFCFEGGGTMRTPEKPSRWCRAPSWCIRPAKCTNTRTARNARCCSACATVPTWSRATSTWRGHPGWTQSAEDADYYKSNPRLRARKHSGQRSPRFSLVILRRAVLHASIGVAALGGFALRKRVVGAFLRRSGLQAEVVMHVLGQGRRTGQGRRKHAGNHDETHRRFSIRSPGSLTRATARRFLVMERSSVLTRRAAKASMPISRNEGSINVQ